MAVDTVESREVQKVQKARKNSGLSRTKQLPGTQETKQPGKVRTDTVSITGSAELLQTLEQKLSVLPVVDKTKVESIKKAIASGQYTFNPEKTAEKFMQLESALTPKKLS
ncbi:MAG: flagellar biosynthesis anti-sigma factor FlgM [Gammaproteobacteria bacterium]|nr:flagellar biosynthesis anti-sigma factor FlgM [Gammaproteobacteria bacterium]MDH5800512.1 flagellar biosynthesis anti-sigma factor FlgM [Gammaproteobacteria bacterium]